MSGTGDRPSAGPLARLQVRHGRRAGAAALGLLALLVAHNAVEMVWNQRELPRHPSTEIQDWFHVSPRDIERVASAHPRPGVYGLMAIWYLLGKQIRGAHLTIPAWMAWSRWELERVSGLEIEVTDQHITVEREGAARLRGAAAEKRIYQRGTRTHRRFETFYLVRDAKATRYVVAEWVRGKQLFVVPEAQYAALGPSAGSRSP